MHKDLSAQRDYKHPTSKVWAAITQPAGAERWLGATGFEATVGHRFAVRFPESIDVDGDVVGEVIEAQEPNRLLLAIHGPSLEGELRVELDEQDKGSRIQLTHSGVGLTDVGRSRMLSMWERVVSEDIVALVSPPSRVNWGLVAITFICTSAVGFSLLSSYMTYDADHVAEPTEIGAPVTETR
ncbi:MAG: hypothetical protein ACI9MC_002033 [Kiritimatiellia bacterium]|jgi:uncharacterized protein YndB with AHSA1/START domain